MSNGEARTITAEDIQTVQRLIEQCLPHYMTKEQVIDILFQQQKIEHAFTELVWQRLEEQNQEFFKSYRLRLAVAKQINDFNNLLDTQSELMKKQQQLDPNRHTFRLPVSNGADIPTIHHSSSFFSTENTEIMQQVAPTVLSRGFYNYNHGPTHNPEMLDPLDMTTQSRRLDNPLNMTWAQNSYVGMNGAAIKTESNHLGNSTFAYRAGGNGNIMETHPRIDIASTSSYGNMDPNQHHLNGTPVNDTSSFDVYRNLPQSQNTDAQCLYMPSFPPPDRANILDHNGSRIENQGEHRRINDISRNLHF